MQTPVDFNLSNRVNDIEARIKVVEQQVCSIHTQIDDIPEKLNKLFIVERNKPQPQPKIVHCYQSPSRLGSFLVMLTILITLAYFLGRVHIG